jgi:hypothetical protein
MTQKEYAELSGPRRLETLNTHYNQWVINWDSRSDNFQANTERWEKEHGWPLPPVDVQNINDSMRKAAGRLWNYTGD